MTKCNRCWYNSRFHDCKDAGKTFSSTKNADGLVEVFFNGVWEGMCPGLPVACECKQVAEVEETAEVTVTAGEVVESKAEPVSR